jgi:hypothetical protein
MAAMLSMTIITGLALLLVVQVTASADMAWVVTAQVLRLSQRLAVNCMPQWSYFRPGSVKSPGWPDLYLVATDE